MGQNFSIFWRDNEGDDITIASDEDLLIALGEMEGSVCKLIVKKREGGEREEDQSLRNEETLSGVSRGNNPNNGGQYRETQEQNTTALPPVILTILQILGINPNGFYLFQQSGVGAPRNQNNQYERIIQLIANQFLRISAMFTQVSITLSSITIMMFLPSFFIHTALYLALATSLGFPLPTLLGGHLLFMLISTTPTFLVFTAAIWAFHRVCVLNKPLVEVDQEFWRRNFDRIISRLQPQN